MKKVACLTFILALTAMLSLAVFSQAPSPGKPQTTCPISGKPIDKAKSPHVDFQGQRIYFCCDDCPAKFKADPEKYFSQFAKDGIVLENVQTTCPVSGEKLEKKDTYVDYKGRRIYFCCPKCLPEFKKDPAKYLAKMSGDQAAAVPAATAAPSAPGKAFVCVACDYVGTKAGKCPKCGKELLAVNKSDVYYSCTMCDVKSDKPGKCPKCGMNMVMKVKESSAKQS